VLHFYGYTPAHKYIYNTVIQFHGDSTEIPPTPFQSNDYPKLEDDTPNR